MLRKELEDVEEGGKALADDEEVGSCQPGCGEGVGASLRFRLGAEAGREEEMAEKDRREDTGAE